MKTLLDLGVTPELHQTVISSAYNVCLIPGISERRPGRSFIAKLNKRVTVPPLAEFLSGLE